MFTYFLYNTILLIAGSFAYLAEHGNTRLFRLCCRVVVFLSLWIPASLRYGTGTDYFNYVGIFNNIDNSTQEVGWILLNKLIHFLGLSSQWVFVFSSFLLYFSLCFIIKRKNYCYSMIFYILLFFYFKSFNIIRQQIAVSFIICAITVLEDKKYIKFVLSMFFAFMFHVSALFILPFLLFKNLKFRRRIVLITITILGIIILFRFNFLIIALSISEKLGLKYARYMNSEFFTSKTPLGSGLGVFANIFVSLLAVCMAPQITKKYPQKAFAVNLSVIYIFSYILAAQFVILGRIRDVFIFVPVIVTGFAIQATGKYKQIVALFLICLSLFLFEYNIQKQTRRSFAMWIYPYYSIFSDVTESELRSGFFK
jgi:hypothetical protein